MSPPFTQLGPVARIGLLADTHCHAPGASDLPQAVLDAFRGADLVIHLATWARPPCWIGCDINPGSATLPARPPATAALLDIRNGVAPVELIRIG